MILHAASHLIQFGSSSYDFGSRIVTDSFGNAYVTAQTDNGIDGHTNARSNDIFIIKFTNAGIKQWTRQLGTSSNDYGYGIATDPYGNVYATGYTEGNLNGNNNAGGNDAFVVKYDFTGATQWTKLLETSSGDIAYDIAADSNSNVYVTGPTLGGLGGTTNAGSYDVFMIKYDSYGN